MEKQKLFLIYNPNSGKGKKKNTLHLIKNLLQDDFNIIVNISNSRRKARDLAKEISSSNNKPIIVAAGGDGTINDVVNGCDITNVILGILPIGTVNIVAKELGIEENIYKACDYIKKGTLSEIDVPTANNTRFLFASGLGFDAEVIRNVYLKHKLIFGKLIYVVKSFLLMPYYTPFKANIIINGKEVYNGMIFQLIAGKTKKYAGDFTLFKTASLNNGIIDIAVMAHQSKSSFALGFAKFFLGVKDKNIRYFKGTKIDVITDNNTPFHVDGDNGNFSPVTFEITQTKLNIITP